MNVSPTGHPYGLVTDDPRRECRRRILPGTTTDAGEAVGGRSEPSADLLRQLDDDPLRAADVAEPIAVFVALRLANELRAAGSQVDAEVGRRFVLTGCALGAVGAPGSWSVPGGLRSPHGGHHRGRSGRRALVVWLLVRGVRAFVPVR